MALFRKKNQKKRAYLDFDKLVGEISRMNIGESVSLIINSFVSEKETQLYLYSRLNMTPRGRKLVNTYLSSVVGLNDNTISQIRFSIFRPRKLTNIDDNGIFASC